MLCHTTCVCTNGMENEMADSGSKRGKNNEKNVEQEKNPPKKQTNIFMVNYSIGPADSITVHKMCR